MPSSAEMRSVVDSYLSLVATGTAEEITALYADDATVEDPVGTPAHVGRDAIIAFYKVIEPIKRATELVSFKAAGNIAVFEFKITTSFPEFTIHLNPVDVMEFADDGKVQTMKALWGPEDMVRADA
ncbi:MAG: steroid Delta-isomerase [Pseudonocardiales bacterium]|nr:steroid Delta-isomerase [Pseudonocardiales bacterium]MDT4922013.1 steroid Delta-isomerase [Pseudonocardiales bacterium]MDT4942230.1 steroid Delta-isomerase [Pseudonocardiales bacterium]